MIEEAEKEEKRMDRFTKTITILGILGMILWATSKFITFAGRIGEDNTTFFLFALIVHFIGILLLLSALFVGALIGRKMPSQVRLGLLIAFALIILSESFPWTYYYY